ncbi:hypothetical protein CROQUDRAFT_523649 [Cronartium quercuum f. sp. fusiforme G11]|uniref:Uncharacterized protein n=1 Tax=Cronartium quercuum f. sp. fusiforme G11 TaxID=708437 RepID=A0A9P6NLQ5_9BASI|nr:hypothetical protein CROQUDRAFT_523649 [Cronartium quercuum f. sp. fusiforme G11]
MVRTEIRAGGSQAYIQLGIGIGTMDLRGGWRVKPQTLICTPHRLRYTTAPNPHSTLSHSPIVNFDIVHSSPSPRSYQTGLLDIHHSLTNK